MVIVVPAAIDGGAEAVQRLLAAELARLNEIFEGLRLADHDLDNGAHLVDAVGEHALMQERGRRQDRDEKRERA